MASSSSAIFYGIREEDLQNQMKLQAQQQTQQQLPPNPTPSTAAPPPPAPPKKKRNLPGTPNPDAEVIALSPKTLMATNRFICEVCNKGFQREQNLQLHRRGHNLPWKLKQKSTKEVKRRVYLCPEPSCVHHDPSRALGDLTGIKKHFCRKHGEKKWKCDKCSKRYAVQSDWKAHSKTCGTREYRCDCGTLFSRRDSFITHRAFCDALAQETARLPNGLNTIGSHLYGSSNVGLGLSEVSSQISSLHDQNLQAPSSNLLRLGGNGGFNHLITPSNASAFRPPHASPSSAAFFLGGSTQDLQESQSHHSLLQSKTFTGLMQLPDLQNTAGGSTSAVSSAAANLFNLSFFSNSSSTSSINNSSSDGNQNSHLLISDQFSNSNVANSEPASFFAGNLQMSDHVGSGGVSSLYNSAVQSESLLPQMSATALLQKAAQMGSSTSSNGSSLLRGFGSASNSPGSAKAVNFRGSFGSGGGGERITRVQAENEAHLQDLMDSLANGSAGIFGGSTRGVSPFGGNCTGSGGGHEQGAAFGAFDPSLCNMDVEAKLHHSLSNIGSMGGSDGLTRDFLGVGSMVRSLGSAAGVSPREQHHRLDHISSLDQSESASRSFAGGNLQ